SPFQKLQRYGGAAEDDLDLTGVVAVDAPAGVGAEEDLGRVLGVVVVPAVAVRWTLVRRPPEGAGLARAAARRVPAVDVAEVGDAARGLRDGVRAAESLPLDGLERGQELLLDVAPGVDHEGFHGAPADGDLIELLLEVAHPDHEGEDGWRAADAALGDALDGRDVGGAAGRRFAVRGQHDHDRVRGVLAGVLLRVLDGALESGAG